MHGSPHARAESPTVSQSHSKTVGRGKYIHEIQRLVVRPDAVDELRAVLAEFYPRLHKSDGGDGGRLVGSWEVVVGDQETFCECGHEQEHALLRGSHAMRLEQYSATTCASRH